MALLPIKEVLRTIEYEVKLDEHLVPIGRIHELFDGSFLTASDTLKVPNPLMIALDCLLDSGFVGCGQSWVLQKGIELVETKFTNGDCTTCCGGGGGFEAVFPELSQILATNRAKELLDTGAELIITQCPGCIMQLKEGLKELKKTNIEVLDLAQILATAMGLS